jgi:outer membrane lipoprotein carrier protein
MCALAHAGPPASSVETVAAAVDARYNKLHTLKAEFTETYSGNGVNRSESGVLWLKKPGKMRWEYRSPQEKVFVSDGKDAWFYVPGDRQARRAPVRQLDDLRSPLSLLLGKTKLDRELEGLSLAPDVKVAHGDLALRGIPKGMKDRVNQVLLEIAPNYEIVRIVIEEVDGATTEYRFSNETENEVIGDDKFYFVPPAGVEVISGEFGR